MFDGTEYGGGASEMPVLQRWRHYADDSSFWGNFDEEMITFVEEIFGLVPEPARLQAAA